VLGPLACGASIREYCVSEVEVTHRDTETRTRVAAKFSERRGRDRDAWEILMYTFLRAVVAELADALA
jgi:hypothetical protein